MNCEIPDFEVGDLVCCKVTGVEKEGYSVELLSSSVKGYYPCKAKLETGTRIEACFVCLDDGKILLAPKSFLKQRQQLTIEETNVQNSEFAPQDIIASPEVSHVNEGAAIDFSPPSDFNSEFLSLITSWKLINTAKEKELKEKVSSGNWEMVGLLKRLDIFTPQELTSIDFGRSLLKREKISWTEFKKAFFDEVSIGIILEDSKLIKSKK